MLPMDRCVTLNQILDKLLVNVFQVAMKKANMLLVELTMKDLFVILVNLQENNDFLKPGSPGFNFIGN